MNSCRISMIPVLLLITIVGVSCVSYPYQEKFMRLQIGMEKEDVLSLMGPPGLNEAYQTKNGGTLEIFFYRTEIYSHHGKKLSSSDCVNASSYGCMPLLIEEGTLIGWGKQFYEEKVKIELDITTSEK